MWRIDKDHIAQPGEESRVGTSEEHSRVPVAAAMIGMVSEPLPERAPGGAALPLVKFRMMDDDGEVYYEGELHDDGECLNQVAALNFGETDAGCATIEVRRGGEWTQEIG